MREILTNSSFAALAPEVKKEEFLQRTRFWKISGSVWIMALLMLFSTGSYGQNGSIKGKVTDGKGLPLGGASIAWQNAASGVSTDKDGTFTLQRVSGSDTLVVSYIGYASQLVATNGQGFIIIRLKPVEDVQSDIVVVGYGTQRRKDLTGSVSSVNGKDLKDLPTTNITSAIQGRAPGVEVINSSGEPGATPTIIIRGLSSLHQPNPLYIVDGVRQSPENINVQDIATIDVLKDASAAAIYGAAAAGGVIVITTKKGSGLNKKPDINFSTRYGVTRPKAIHLLDREGYIKMQNIINPNIFAGADQTDTLPNTDWTDVIYRNGIEQNYNLSISGASPVVNYLFSGFYNNQKGIFIRNYSNIGGARVNTDYKLGRFIKIGEQMAVSQRKGMPVNPLMPQLFNAPFRTLPIIAKYNADGQYGSVPPGYGISFGGPNPYGMIQSSNIQNTQNNFQGNVYAEVKLPLNLSFRTTWGYTYYSETQNYFQDNQYFGPSSPATNSLNKYNIQSTQTLDNFVLTYDKTLGKHHINAMAGFEQINSSFNNINAGESSIGLPGFSFVKTSASVESVSGSYDPQGLIKSYFGRINYNFDDRYYLSGSIRQDANFTVFGPEKQKGVFGSVSAGWNISDEAFFKPLLPVINQLKLRGSYGSLGNSNITPYLFLATYSQFQGTSGAANGGQNFTPDGPLFVANSINMLPNPSLHWESIYETNIGLDASALNDHLYFTAEWYNRKTKDMLYALPLPFSSGFVTYFTNIGEVQSKGFDLLLGYKDQAGKLGYDISLNAGFNNNKVLNLGGITNDAIYDGRNYYNNLDPSGFNMMGTNNITITKKGLPFGSFYGFKSEGLFKTDQDAAGQKVNGVQSHAGDLIFQDLDGDGNITAADRQVIGNPNPKLVYGINIRLNYQGFDVAMLFNGVQGVDLFNGVKAYEQFSFADGNTTSQIFGSSFFGDNGLTSQPRVLDPDGTLNASNPNYNTVNSYFVENGSYLKLKNLQIGYTFSNRLLQQISIKSARLFVMGNNLFTITNYSGLDPELGSSYSTNTASGIVGTNVGVTTRGVDAVEQYPQTRIYTVGLDINF